MQKLILIYAQSILLDNALVSNRELQKQLKLRFRWHIPLHHQHQKAVSIQNAGCLANAGLNREFLSICFYFHCFRIQHSKPGGVDPFWDLYCIIFKIFLKMFSYVLYADMKKGWFISSWGPRGGSIFFPYLTEFEHIDKKCIFRCA